MELVVLVACTGVIQQNSQGDLVLDGVRASVSDATAACGGVPGGGAPGGVLGFIWAFSPDAHVSLRFFAVYSSRGKTGQMILKTN